MNHSEYLLDIVIFLVAAVIVVPLFQRFRSSPILGYLAAGIIIGPHGFAIIGDTDTAHTLAEFGVVFLLFMIGLELSFGRLKMLGSKVFGLGSLQVVVTGTIIGAAVWWFGFNLNTAAIVGGGLALSSTAFVLQLLGERGERGTRFGLTTFSILLLQDLAVVPLLIFITLLSAEGSSFFQAISFAVIKGGIGLVIVFLFGRYLLKPLYGLIASMRSPELFVSTTLLMILGMGLLMKVAGLSMELGALLAGLLLAETQYRHQIEADIKPFRGILLGLFFMTIGMSIDIALIIDQLNIIAFVVISLLVVKILVTTALCRVVGTPLSTSIRTGFALSQGGEFGFVLFGAALALKLIPENLAQILMASIALTMVATPFLFGAGQRISCWIKGSEKPSEMAFDSSLEGQSNHVLIAGFGRVGQTVAKVISDAGIPYIALDLDQSRVTKCRAKGMSVYFGDADQIAVLNAAGAPRAKMAVITLDQQQTASRVVAALRDNYPDLPIYVRARDRQHMAHLELAGASAVVSEAAESSLQLGGIVLNSLDVSADEIASVLQEYREDDYKRLEDIISG